MPASDASLRKVVTAFIAGGLVFMLLPGTFLGVWNLLSISAQHTVASLPPAWMQAHGHAQIFGWLGSFILGIGFYSLSKMGKPPQSAVSRGWWSFALWTAGVLLRWAVNITEWHWRVGLPLSALLELAGFLTFFRTVSGHKAAGVEGAARPKREPWMLVVMASTFGFLVTLLANVAVTADAAIRGGGPAIAMVLDQRLLMLPTWLFLVPTVWGFNARWLPVFLGLRPLRRRFLYAAVAFGWLASACMLCGWPLVAAVLLAPAALSAVIALGVWERGVQAAKLNGVHASFPAFVRGAYGWLLIAAAMSVLAALADREGGIWGASRHALTVGFLATMVFAIGQKILPAFCGARVLFSTGVMFASLLLLTLGCALRVICEPLAYEGVAAWAWHALPCSAVIELTAVTLFALNLAFTFARPSNAEATAVRA